MANPWRDSKHSGKHTSLTRGTFDTRPVFIVNPRGTDADRTVATYTTAVVRGNIQDVPERNLSMIGLAKPGRSRMTRLIKVARFICFIRRLVKRRNKKDSRAPK